MPPPSAGRVWEGSDRMEEEDTRTAQTWSPGRPGRAGSSVGDRSGGKSAISAPRSQQHPASLADAWQQAGSLSSVQQQKCATASTTASVRNSAGNVLEKAPISIQKSQCKNSTHGTTDVNITNSYTFVNLPGCILSVNWPTSNVTIPLKIKRSILGILTPDVITA